MKRMVCLLAILPMILACGLPSLAPTEVTSSYTSYSNPDVGMSFRYPAFLTPATETVKERDSSGFLIQTTTISLSSSDPTFSMYVEAIDDPYLAAMPDWYPPSEETLRIFVATALGRWAAEEREANAEAVMAALDSITYTEISGFPAAVYQVTFDETRAGQLYMRGAEVISPNRSFTLACAGSIEPDAPGSVAREYVDAVWSEFVESISLVDP